MLNNLLLKNSIVNKKKHLYYVDSYMSKKLVNYITVINNKLLLEIGEHLIINWLLKKYIYSNLKNKFYESSFKLNNSFIIYIYLLNILIVVLFIC